MDDGWFSNRNDARSSLGDWYCSTEKFPNGLGALSDELHRRGLKFGLWLEPEMVSVDSHLYRMHPEWCLGVHGRAKQIARHQVSDMTINIMLSTVMMDMQMVLDLSRADVRQYIFDAISAIMKSTRIEVNNNRISFTSCASLTLVIYRIVISMSNGI